MSSDTTTRPCPKSGVFGNYGVGSVTDPPLDPCYTIKTQEKSTSAPNRGPGEGYLQTSPLRQFFLNLTQRRST